MQSENLFIILRHMCEEVLAICVWSIAYWLFIIYLLHNLLHFYVFQIIHLLCLFFIFLFF